ncbi:unnamed protein product [Ectocarpus sp. CCAP 1310/34]|nr:unnamed protein product [Ectocarpus sp. CCAP 1310/34]
MVSGVDPVVGGEPVVGSKKEAKKIVFRKGATTCHMDRVTGTQFGVAFCGSSK